MTIKQHIIGGEPPIPDHESLEHYKQRTQQLEAAIQRHLRTIAGLEAEIADLRRQIDEAPSRYLPLASTLRILPP